MSRFAKRLLFAAAAAACLWLALFAVDASRCARLARPLFVRPAETMDDGGSGLYAGPLYRVQLQLDGSLPDPSPVYIRMTLLGLTVAESGVPLPKTARAISVRDTNTNTRARGSLSSFGTGSASCSPTPPASAAIRRRAASERLPFVPHRGKL